MTPTLLSFSARVSFFQASQIVRDAVVVLDELPAIFVWLHLKRFELAANTVFIGEAFSPVVLRQFSSGPDARWPGALCDLEQHFLGHEISGPHAFSAS